MKAEELRKFRRAYEALQPDEELGHCPAQPGPAGELPFDLAMKVWLQDESPSREACLEPIPGCIDTRVTELLTFDFCFIASYQQPPAAFIHRMHIFIFLHSRQTFACQRRGAVPCQQSRRPPCDHP